MAVIKYSKAEVEKHLKLDEQTLHEISMFGIPNRIVENEFEIELSPNRPDLIPLQRFIHAFKTFQGKFLGLKKYKINKPEKNYEVRVDKSVKEVRPYTCCAIVKNLSLNNERIKDLVNVQEKLHSTLGRNRRKLAIGIYPLEKIKLPIKYEARKPAEIKFTPLEGTKEMNALQILKNHSTGREYADLLKDCEKYPVFADSNDKILSMPPIINSNETGKITQSTTEVFIECSGFDLAMLSKTLSILVIAFAEMGGRIYAMKINDKPDRITPDLTSEKMKISADKVNKLLGLNLKEKDLEKLLPRMEYEYKNGRVSTPAWRSDVLHEVDIIEDIAIAYGYDKLAPELAGIATIAEGSKESKLIRKISEILIGLGLLEISSYNLIKKEEAEKFKIKKTIEIENSKTEYKILRPNLLISALRILSENKDNEYPQNIFEIGKVFDKNEEQETGIKENTNLIIALTPSNFTKAKQHLDYLFKNINLQYTIKESSQNLLIEGRTGSILIEDKEIGYIGEMHPQTLNSWNLKMPLAVLEINLDEIFSRI